MSKKPAPKPKPARSVLHRVESLRRIEVKPGDKFVIRLQPGTTRASADEIRQLWVDMFPRNEVLVLRSDVIEVGILNDDETD